MGYAPVLAVAGAGEFTDNFGKDNGQLIECEFTFDFSAVSCKTFSTSECNATLRESVAQPTPAPDTMVPVDRFTEAPTIRITEAPTVSGAVLPKTGDRFGWLVAVVLVGMTMWRMI